MASRLGFFKSLPIPCSVAQFSFVVPRQVVFDDVRVLALHWSITFLVAGLFALRFIWFRHYVAYLPIGQAIDVSMHPLDISHDELTISWVHASTARTCTQSHRFDYWMTKDEHYETEGCLRACSAEASTDSSCRPANDFYLRERHDQMFFITRQEALSKAGSTQVKRAHFVGNVDAMGLGFKFQYVLDMPSFLYPLIGDSYERAASSRRNILTVVLDSVGQVHKVEKPSDGIEFLLPELLSLAGNPDYLDAFDATKPTNQKPNPAFASPIGRVSGGTLALMLDCHDRLPGGMEEISEVWNSGQYDAMCIVRVQLGEDHWVSHERIDDSEGSPTKLHSNGIRVVCRPHGKFGYVDVNLIFLNIVIICVLIAMAKHITTFIMTRYFGELSTIYRRCMFDAFDMRSHVAKVATHAMMCSAVYDDLRDPGLGGISRDRFKDQLGLVCRQWGVTNSLRDEDYDAFLTFCWEASMLEDNRANYTLDFDGKGQPIRKQISRPKDAMSMKGFHGSSSSSSERSSFTQAAKFFDHRRKPKLLEKVFMPPSLQHSFSQAAKHATEIRVRREQEFMKPFVTQREELESMEQRLKKVEEMCVDLGREEKADLQAFRQNFEGRLKMLEQHAGHEVEDRLLDLERERRTRARSRASSVFNPLPGGLAAHVSSAAVEAMEEKLTNLEEILVDQRIQDRLRDLESQILMLKSGRQRACEVKTGCDESCERPPSAGKQSQAVSGISALQDQDFKDWFFGKLSVVIHDQATMLATCDAVAQQVQELTELCDKIESRMESIEDSKQPGLGRELSAATAASRRRSLFGEVALFRERLESAGGVPPIFASGRAPSLQSELELDQLLKAAGTAHTGFIHDEVMVQV